MTQGEKYPSLRSFPSFMAAQLSHRECELQTIIRKAFPDLLFEVTPANESWSARELPDVGTYYSRYTTGSSSFDNLVAEVISVIREFSVISAVFYSHGLDNPPLSWTLWTASEEEQYPDFGTEVRIERVVFDEHRMNTLGHARDERVPPELDLETEIRRTALERWRHVVNYPVVFEFEFTRNETDALVDCMPFARMTGRIPDLHEAKVAALTARLESVMNAHESLTGWFCRFNQQSPKDGELESNALRTAADVVQQIVTSRGRARICFNEDDRRLYFCRYRADWKCRENELRGFVYDGKLTALSQYSPTSRYFARLAHDELVRIVQAAKRRIAAVMNALQAAIGTRNVVCDFIWEEERGDVAIVEFNSFGHWLRTGSAFFHWLDNWDILHSDGSVIVMRVNRQ
jgi:hypothetical protein